MKIPVHYERLGKRHPELLAAYEAMSRCAAEAGPLSDRERALLKLAISLGAGLEGGMASHARKALEIGVPPEDLEHVALMALPTLGLPRTMMGWKKVNQVIEESKLG